MSVIKKKKSFEFDEYLLSNRKTSKSYITNDSKKEVDEKFKSLKYLGNIYEDNSKNPSNSNAYYEDYSANTNTVFSNINFDKSASFSFENPFRLPQNTNNVTFDSNLFFCNPHISFSYSNKYNNESKNPELTIKSSAREIKLKSIDFALSNTNHSYKIGKSELSFISKSVDKNNKLKIDNSSSKLINGDKEPYPLLRRKRNSVILKDKNEKNGEFIKKTPRSIELKYISNGKEIENLNEKLSFSIKNSSNKIICGHPECQNQFKTRKQKFMHHNKSDPECRHEKQLLIKLIMYYKNSILGLTKNNKFKNNEKILSSLKKEFETIKANLIDTDYFNLTVGEKFEEII